MVLRQNHLITGNCRKQGKMSCFFYQESGQARVSTTSRSAFACQERYNHCPLHTCAILTRISRALHDAGSLKSFPFHFRRLLQEGGGLKQKCALFLFLDSRRNAHHALACGFPLFRMGSWPSLQSVYPDSLHPGLRPSRRRTL